MSESVIAALIAVVSLVVGQVLQHILDLRKRAAQLKDHPSRVLYDKQTEFFDKMAPVLVEVTRYIGSISGWVNIGAIERALQEADANECVAKLFALTDQYHIYIPSEVLAATEELTKQCLLLDSARPTLEYVDSARHSLFILQNTMRRFVGIDTVSAELMSALGQPRNHG